MPELPEVETVRRQLSIELPGHRITGVIVHDPLSVAPDGGEALAPAVGREVRSLGRRGKYLIINLDNASRLVVHLRMTGRLLIERPGIDDHTRFLRVTFVFDDGRTVLFCDPRRFGRIAFHPANGDPEAYWRRRVGVEPLFAGFTPEVLGDLFARRRTSVKAALLNQALVAGVGNIYADEALHLARIHPETPAGSLSRNRITALRDAIVAVLRTGIDTGGASINTYYDARGGRGSMQDVLQVHRREGKPCPRCGTTIVKSRVAQRGTYHCPRCQRRR